MRVLDALVDMLPQKSSVQMVADDPQLASELLLLIRMMFADGELKKRELALFKEICEEQFGIPEEDVPEVIGFLKDYGYETNGAQAARTFVEVSEDRKHLLLDHLLSMARVDDMMHGSEVDLIARIALIFGFTPEQVRERT